MNRFARTVMAGLSLWVAITQPALGNSPTGKIDGARSTITVRVYKSGFLSAFGHDLGQIRKRLFRFFKLI